MRYYIIIFSLFLVFSCKISNNKPNHNNEKIDSENIITLNESNNKGDINLQDNNGKLKKTIIITNYDVERIIILVREICIRWNMFENREYKIYPNQKLFYYYKFDEAVIEESKRLQYVVLYTSNNTIYIEMQDYLTISSIWLISSKWLENFTIDIINILNNNGIKYEEILYMQGKPEFAGQ